jgi:SAM-dependent methyltransferase
MKQLLKALLPQRLRLLRYELIDQIDRFRMGKMSNEEAFSRIYDEGLWGKTSELDSGPGSRQEFIAAYCEAIEEHVIRPFGVTRLVDIGCGDFRVGRELARRVVRYTGVDVVPKLIERNQAEFGSGAVGFQCLDATKTAPPEADACAIRQVLQHLTNEEVRAVLRNCAHIPVLVVTEHLYVGSDGSPNRNIAHGVGTRVDIKSGLFLDRPPFEMDARTILELPYGPNEVLRTVMIVNRQ